MQCHYINESVGYTCSCPLGYNGTKCDVFINLCDSNPCGAGGFCHSFAGFYKCVCKSGYHGTNCEEQLALEGIFTVVYSCDIIYSKL